MDHGFQFAETNSLGQHIWRLPKIGSIPSHHPFTAGFSMKHQRLGSHVLSKTPKNGRTITISWVMEVALITNQITLSWVSQNAFIFGDVHFKSF